MAAGKDGVEVPVVWVFVVLFAAAWVDRSTPIDGWWALVVVVALVWLVRQVFRRPSGKNPDGRPQP